MRLLLCPFSHPFSVCATGNSKQALRCKTCKMAAHLWCTSDLSQQPCYGKSGAFKRNFSSPMIINDQLAVVKEVHVQEMSSPRLPTVKQEVENHKEEEQPEVQPLPQKNHRSRVDPIYAALRYGTSLAQMSRSSFGSLSESPTRSLGEGGGEMERQYSMEEEMPTETAAIPVPDIEIETEEESSDALNQTPAEEISLKVPKCIDVQSIHTYVALYKFLPQEQNDLELQ
uniref:Phorbol-ester/DAG-type domain-containing protein n=1 Tax=Knipowitschia caucasica TaxID=637954 RepID=A0AAV2KIJ3_KNICA